MKSKKLFMWLGLTVFATITICLQGITSVNAQNDKKIVQLANSGKPQLKISDVKLGHQSVELGELFKAEPYWIENLSFKLENISNKPIVFLQANVNFPETRLTGKLMSYAIYFGQRPDSKFKTNRNPFLLKPDETLEIFLDKETTKIYKFINQRQPVETINKVDLEIGFIIFEDKTAWTAGAFMRQDPANPDRYIPIGISPQQ